MKLISTLTNTSSKVINSSVISENCSIGQAITMIESWCYDNDANYPSTSDIWKNNGKIQITVKTRDHKYINIFDITD